MCCSARDEPAQRRALRPVPRIPRHRRHLNTVHPFPSVAAYTQNSNWSVVDVRRRRALRSLHRHRLVLSPSITVARSPSRSRWQRHAGWPCL
jgi:hypothetical protein